MRLLSVAALLALGLSAHSAHAQWVPIGGGDFGVNFEFQSSATFSCIKQHYATQPCTSFGTSLVQWNGDAFAELSFTGVTANALATNKASSPIYVGDLNVRYGGTGSFTWPAMVAPGIGSFAMFLRLQTINAPFTSTGRIQFQFMQVTPTLVGAYLGEAHANFLELGLPYPQPSHLNYHGLVFDAFNMPHIDQTDDADYQIFATSVSVIPEPSTYALLSVGLGMFAVAAKRRRKR
jgi:PEP-CTERM motif